MVARGGQVVPCRHRDLAPEPLADAFAIGDSSINVANDDANAAALRCIC